MAPAVFALGLSAPCAVQPLPAAASSAPPPPSSIEDSGGWPLFSSTLWSCWPRNLGGTSLDMYRCCWGVWLPEEDKEEEEGCPLATEVRCFALFPPPGGTCAETLAALGLGDEGATGPGLGDTEPGLASGWAQDTLADSGTEIHPFTRMSMTWMTD